MRVTRKEVRSFNVSREQTIKKTNSSNFAFQAQFRLNHLSFLLVFHKYSLKLLKAISIPLSGSGSEVLEKTLA